MKKILLVILVVTSAFVGQAQESKWKPYRMLLEQLSALRSDSTTTCDQLLEAYRRIDSLDDSQMPNYMLLINYMNVALDCGDTATFKQQLIRAMKWKSWNAGLLDYYPYYAFLKEDDDWPRIDSLSHIYGDKKIYPYMDSLAIIAQRDQEVRKSWIAQGLTREQADSIGKIWHVTDSINFAHFEELVVQYGFPTWERVGCQGADNAWLIAQHDRLPFRYWFTKEYRKAVRDNNADIRHLAYLEDRDRTERGLPQRYGTQFMSVPTDDGFERVWQLPIADIKHVDLRRDMMNMESLEDYIVFFSKRGRLSHDSQFYPVDEDYIKHYYNGGVHDIQQAGIVDAQRLMVEGRPCDALSIFCENLSCCYPFVQDLKRYLLFLLRNPACGLNKGKFISTYEILERMVLCGYEPDEFLELLPDSLSSRLQEDYAELRADYLSCLDNEGNAEFLKALESRKAFVKLLKSGKNYHRFDIDGWNHALPALQTMVNGLSKHNYKAFFKLLWNEVVRGNLHTEDYALLYERTYKRLFHSTWYCALPAEDEIWTDQQIEEFNKHRKEICLPTIEVARQINDMLSPKPKGMHLY